jgi:hypothetical protein
MDKSELDKIWVHELAHISNWRADEIEGASALGIQDVYTGVAGYSAQVLTTWDTELYRRTRGTKRAKIARARILKAGEYQFETGAWTTPGAARGKLNRAIEQLNQLDKYRKAVARG